MPGDPTLTNFNDEVRSIQAYQIRRMNVQSQVRRFTPTSAALYANYAKAYWWMKPGLIRAAAMAGISPDNPDMVRLSRVAYAEGIESGRLANGSNQRASNLNPGFRDPTLYSYNTLGHVPQDNGVVDDPLAQYAEFIDGDGQLIRPAEPHFEGNDDEGMPIWKYDSDADKQADHKFTELLRLISDQQDSNKPIPYQINDEWRQWHPKTGASEVIDTTPTSTSGFSNALIEQTLLKPISAEIPVISPAVRGVQAVAEPAYQAIQPPIRVAGMAANYPVQEFQQVGRNLHSIVKYVQEHGYAEALAASPDEIGVQGGGETTDLGIALEGLVSGERVDTGSGFFVSPTSQVAQERVRREARNGQIGGHNVTWGRWIASSVTDPDTVPFDVMSGFVDLAVQVGDPTAAGLGEVGRARRAAQLFEAENVDEGLRFAGLLGSRGRKPTVDTNTAEKVFDSTLGTRAIEDLTNTTSAYQIAKKMSANKLEIKHDPALYEALARTTQTSETRAILSDAISTGKIREVADLTKSWGHGIAANIRPRMPRSRLMDKMPGQGIHLSDPKDVANNILRHYRNVNAPEEAMEEAFNVLAKATTRSGRRNAVLQVFGSGPNSILAHHNIDPEIADQLTRVFKSSVNEMWRGLVDELGTEIPTWEHVLANGEKTLVPGPHALIELIEDYMPLPDARALRELTNKFPNLITKLPEGSTARFAAELPGAAVEYWLQEIWKPLALMRGAWLVRVLGEGQMRIAADGLDSLFSGHPLEALGFMMSKRRIPTGVIPGLKDIEPRMAVSFLDDPWDEIYEYENALSRVNNWTYRPGSLDTVTETTLYAKGRHADTEFRHAWARQLLKFNYDPVYFKWMTTDSLDEMTEWLTRGPGQKYLREFQEGMPGNMRTPEQVRKYLDDIERRFNILTSGNTDLFDILRSGEFTNSAGDTVSIYRAGTRSAGNPELNPEFSRHLSSYMDDAPIKVPGRKMRATRGKSDYPTLRRYAVQNFLYGAMSRSENLLARAPVFKQAYAREMADMIQFGTAEARTELIAKARELNVPNRVIKQMEHYSAIKKPGNLNIDEMDIVAKGRAMDRAQKLLYSYSERRQVFDITRNFFPFGDAWYEVMSTWGRIIRNTAGKPLRRGQQVIEGSINSGFFHENQFGELAFTYPFSRAISEALTGTPVQMEGRVQGLSMFGEVVPGLGPVAQIPAAWFLKDKPELKALEDVLLPFGGPEGADVLNIKSYFPGWLKTAFSLAGLKTMDDKRLWENTVGQEIDYLASTGEYGYTEAEQTRLLQDAKDAARKVYALRVMAQFIAPASPSLQFYVEDKTGTRLSAIALAQEFHEMEDGPNGDFETSVSNFVAKYGPNALGALVASSATSVPGLPDSREGQDWVDNNQDIKGKYPLVYALFAPTGEFDIDVYTRQFTGPDRQALTADQHAAMLSDWLNRYWRTEAMNRMGVKTYAEMNQTQRNAWEDISEVIDDTYPSSRVGIYEKPQVEDMIEQLEAAAQDPALQDNPAYPALQQYLQYRADAQAAVEALKERGLIDSQIRGFTKAKALRPLREALRQNAQYLISQYPEFEPLWEFVFSRELIKE